MNVKIQTDFKEYDTSNWTWLIGIGKGVREGLV
jgi:hypothetical protein